MNKKVLISFITVIFLLLLLFVVSVNTGSIKVTYTELLKGLFVEYNENVETIKDLRFPRIIIAMLTGGALAVSGVLFQSVLKNPLADPGIIGISSAAAFVSTFIVGFLPQLFFLSPLFPFIGGIEACVLVYTLSYKGGFSPLRIILVGVAVNAVFTGLSSALTTMSGQNYEGAAAIVNANISMKTWEDVRLLALYVVIGLVFSLFMAKGCNIMALEDKTIRGLGVNVTRLRVLISGAAVLLASITTAVAGTISFIGLIVPHIGRLLVGNNHKLLLPFSAALGALIMLGADTAGRVIAYPYEISPAVIMSVIGGPFFIILLKRSDKTYGS
ncbi:MAG: iron ABC transporter permease [Clostridia bacterium]|nr:iron ABC transporter permease [Clostridia bacterium]